MDEELIARAGEILRRGGVVAFPTETVYGLGANALDAAAVRRIYEIKGRPNTSPLIVHVATVEQARELAEEWPAGADRLAAEFWPGPLTLVVKKKALIPDAITAGLDTVGMRIPKHPLALALLRAAGVPVAAPSANLFMGLSPTRAEHVRESLGGAVDLILDGGAADVGIESTVLSLAGEKPVLLRPGMIRKEQIEALIGPVEMVDKDVSMEGGHASPGMHERHYAPRTRLVLVRGAEELERETGAGVYLHVRGARAGGANVGMPREAERYSQELYARLHECDRVGYAWIGVEIPGEGGEWAGILDRLTRAAKAST